MPHGAQAYSRVQKNSSMQTRVVLTLGAQLSSLLHMDLIDSRETARLLGVSIPTVNRWAIAGRLPVAQRTSGKRGHRLFERREIERLAAVSDETRAAS
jgi:excisionase family DNA binding protein